MDSVLTQTPSARAKAGMALGWPNDSHLTSLNNQRTNITDEWTLKRSEIIWHLLAKYNKNPPNSYKQLWEQMRTYRP